jgi:hypothetical protein
MQTLEGGIYHVYNRVTRGESAGSTRSTDSARQSQRAGCSIARTTANEIAESTNLAHFLLFFGQA